MNNPKPNEDNPHFFKKDEELYNKQPDGAIYIFSLCMVFQSELFNILNKP